jgi:hypothetical protein
MNDERNRGGNAHSNLHSRRRCHDLVRPDDLGALAGYLIFIRFVAVWQEDLHVWRR